MAKRYIDADEVLRKMNEHLEQVQMMYETGSEIDDGEVEYIKALHLACRFIDGFPTTDVRPNVKGEWKRRIVDSGFNADWVCNKCGHRVQTEDVSYNFCPNCGADMRKKGEE